MFRVLVHWAHISWTETVCRAQELHRGEIVFIHCCSSSQTREDVWEPLLSLDFHRVHFVTSYSARSVFRGSLVVSKLLEVIIVFLFPWPTSSCLCLRGQIFYFKSNLLKLEWDLLGWQGKTVLSDCLSEHTLSFWFKNLTVFSRPLGQSVESSNFFCIWLASFGHLVTHGCNLKMTLFWYIPVGIIVMEKLKQVKEKVPFYSCAGHSNIKKNTSWFSVPPLFETSEWY